MEFREKAYLSIASSFRFFFINAAVITLQMLFEGISASSFQIGLIQSAMWGGILIFAQFWGALADITGEKRKVLMFSTVVAGVLMPFFSIIENIWGLLFLMFVISSFSSSFPPIGLAITSERSEKDDRGRNMSVFNSSRSVGITTGRMLAGVFLGFMAYREIFLFYGAVGIATVLAVWKLSGTDSHRSFEIKNAVKESLKKIVPRDLGRLWHKNGHKYLLMAIFIRKAAITGVYSMLPIFIVTVKGLSNGSMGVIAGTGPAVQIILMLVFGNLVDRLGRKKVFSAGFLLCATVPIIYAYSTTFWMFISGSIILGIAFSAITAGTTAFIGDIAPKKRQGELLGVRKTVQGLAGVFGGIAGGVLTGIMGYHGMFYTMSGMMVLGFFIALYKTSETLSH